jgi:DNA-binding ferritin-like protein
MHRKLIHEMLERASQEDIKALADVSEMLLDNIKESEPGFYKHAESVLYEAYYGKKLTHERAEKIIHCMKPYGMKWTEEQTTEVMKAHGMSLDPIEFWVVMNMAYNDYHKMFDEDIEKYVEFSKLFINDEDAKEGKVYEYFTKIPKK